MRSTFLDMTLVVTCGVVVAACSGSSSGGAAQPGVDGGGASDANGGSDAGVVDGGGTPDADAASAVQLLGSIPADGTLHVSVLSTIVLRFSGSLKPSSVDATTVKILAPNTTAPLPATATYDDATHTITLTPKTAMRSGGVYRVSASSLVAADGSPLPNVAVTFTTLYNSYTDYSNYNGSTRTSLTKYTLQTDGQIALRATMAAGPDALFGTADDVPTAYAKMTYTPTSFRSVYYNAAGSDGVWFTADDVINLVGDYDGAMIGHPRTLYHGGAGPDGVWFTADDVFQSAYETIDTPDGLESKATGYSGLGPDGMPFTADDVISFTYADTWTATTGQRVNFTGAGVDGMWNTADDVVGGVTNYTRDALGRTTALIFVGKGPDGVWRTADDVTTGIWSLTYDAKGLATRFTILSGAGPDGMWGTADDVPAYYFGFAYDAAGALIARTEYSSAGVDGIWFTADDPAVYIEHMNTML